MTGETPAPAEQNESAAEFTERLYGKLAEHMTTSDRVGYTDGMGHQLVLRGPVTDFLVDDYLSAELSARREGADALLTLRREALANGTVILDISAQDREQYTDLSSVIIVRPSDVPEGGGPLSTSLDTSGANRGDTTRIVLGQTLGAPGYSVITDPSQYQFLVDLASEAIVPKVEDSSELAAKERLRTVAEFARQIHTKLSDTVPIESFDGARHSATLQTASGRTITIQDDFWQNLKGRGFSTDKAQNLRARREDLRKHHTSIISISSPNPDTTQPVDQYLTFIPDELNPGSILGAHMYPVDRDGNPQPPAGEPVDMDSTDYVIWHITKGRIIDPASEPLLVDIAHTLEVAVPEQG